MARIRLQVVDSSGSVVGPGDALALNTNFTLQAWVQDIQGDETPDDDSDDDPSNAQGIFQAYVDAFYDSNLVARVPGGQVTFGPEFPAALSLGGTALGVLNEVGALGDTDPPKPAGRRLPVLQRALQDDRCRSGPLHARSGRWSGA